MAPAMKAKKVAMKAMKGQKAMTKGALLGELATATDMKRSDITKVLNTLTEIGTQEVKKSGKFVLPGLCMIKTRQKAATKGGTRMMFGQEMKVKPQPAKTVVKAFPASQLKSQIWGHAERLMLVAPWGFGAQLVFQRLSLMYTKSPWVLVEIYHHCSFGHSERSDLRDKKNLVNENPSWVETDVIVHETHYSFWMFWVPIWWTME